MKKWSVALLGTAFLTLVIMTGGKGDFEQAGKGDFEQAPNSMIIENL